MQFDIKDFQEKSVAKFYYDRGRHTSTSLRWYKGDLYVHKLLGAEYKGVSDAEYKKEINLMESIFKFLKDKTKFKLPETVYLEYNSESNCIERIEKYSGITLRYAFPTANEKERKQVAAIIINQINSLIEANDNKIDLDYSIDPTPDNFTYDGKVIYFIDFMPPLVRGKKIDPQLISDKSRTKVDLSVQMFRYFNQKGLYLTFLTKFGAVDITFFHELFSMTRASIKNQEVKEFLYNDDIKYIKNLTRKRMYCNELELKIRRRLESYDKVQRDVLRLLGLYFITDISKIKNNAKKYRAAEVMNFLENKRSTADLINGLIYSEFRGSEMHEDFKEVVIDLIALQYGC